MHTHTHKHTNTNTFTFLALNAYALERVNSVASTWGIHLSKLWELTQITKTRTCAKGKMNRTRNKEQKRKKRKNKQLQQQQQRIKKLLNDQSQTAWKRRTSFTYFNLHKYLAFQCSILITNKIENVEHWLSRKHTQDLRKTINKTPKLTNKPTNTYRKL